MKHFFGDAHSIESYQQAMKRLEELRHQDEAAGADAGSRAHVRLVPGARGAPGSTARNGTSARATGRIPKPARSPGNQTAKTAAKELQAEIPRLVFVDDSLLQPPGEKARATGNRLPPSPETADDIATGLSVVGGDKARGGPDRASTSRPSNRSLAGALAFTTLVGGGTALLLLALHHGGSTPRSTAGTHATASNPPVTALTPPSTAPPVSQTTRPRGPLVSLAGSGTSSATYSVSGGPVSLSVSATAPCWIQVRTAASGPVVYTGLLGPSEQKTFPDSGTLWMRVGFPAGLHVAVDGTPVPLPASSNPYDLTFDQAAT